MQIFHCLGIHVQGFFLVLFENLDACIFITYFLRKVIFSLFLEVNLAQLLPVYLCKVYATCVKPLLLQQSNNPWKRTQITILFKYRLALGLTRIFQPDIFNLPKQWALCQKTELFFKVAAEDIPAVQFSAYFCRNLSSKSPNLHLACNCKRQRRRKRINLHACDLRDFEEMTELNLENT